MVNENRPGGNANFDHDPTPSRHLGELTLQFLQTYKESDEFRYGYNLGNLQFADPNRLSGSGKRKAIWVQAFADRLFGVQTINEADRLLEPWMRWGEVHSAIWYPYYNEDHGDEDYNSRYKRTRELFNEVPVPEEIKEYQGDLTDEDLRSLADGLLWLTGDIRHTIDLTEGLPKPASVETVFKTQRILGRPVEPAGGFEAAVVDKPNVRRVEHEGKSYVTFSFDEPAEFGYEDISSEEEWQRWDHIEVGTHVKYVYEDRRSRQKTSETGIVQGFELMGAGDAMMFAPGVSKIGIIVLNEETRFYQCPLVSDIRLDDEEFTGEELLPKPPEPVDLVVIEPQTGKVTESTFGSMKEASEAVVRQLSEGLGRD